MIGKLWIVMSSSLGYAEGEHPRGWSTGLTKTGQPSFRNQTR